MTDKKILKTLSVAACRRRQDGSFINPSRLFPRSHLGRSMMMMASHRIQSMMRARPLTSLPRIHDACFVHGLPEDARTTNSFSADRGMNWLRRVNRSTTLEFCRHEKTRCGTINDRRFFALVIAT
jgi:hypothetical protein